MRRAVYLLTALAVAGLAILAFLVQKGTVDSAGLPLLLQPDFSVSLATAARIPDSGQRVALAEGALRADPATPYKWCALAEVLA